VRFFFAYFGVDECNQDLSTTILLNNPRSKANIAREQRLHLAQKLDCKVPVRLPKGFRSKFLDALTPTEAQVVLAAATEEPFFPGQVLQWQGETAHRMRLPLSGLVEAYKLVDEGCKLFLGWGSPGDVFGLSTLLNESSPYQVTVEAAQRGSLLTWDLSSSRMLVGQFPNMVRAAHSVLASYLDDFIDLLAVRSFLTARQRLARILVKSARQVGRVGHDGVELDLTNAQIALMAQVGLFTTARQLSKWQALGIVTKKRGKILLRSLPRLENITKVGGRRP
jgi:CRP-like cAMP-binding protein